MVVPLQHIFFTIIIEFIYFYFILTVIYSYSYSYSYFSLYPFFSFFSFLGRGVCLLFFLSSFSFFLSFLPYLIHNCSETFSLQVYYPA